MTDIILSGCNGKMGLAVRAAVSAREDCRIVAGVDIHSGGDAPFPVYEDFSSVPGDMTAVVIDFSHPSALEDILRRCEEHPGTAAVLCTTGYSPEQVERIRSASQTIPLLYSRNMSLGVNLLVELAKKAAEVLGSGFDVEIIEMHHNQKLDAPSGTALMLADAVNSVRDEKLKYTYDRHSRRKQREPNEVGLHSVRGGTIVGEHQVIFAGQHEVLTLSHSAQSKELFASGAVNAAVFLRDKGPGLYSMADLVTNSKQMEGSIS